MFVIDCDKLEIGRPLRFDITTVDGRLLASQGTRVTDELRSDWISRGITRVCSYIASDFANQPEHLRPYDPVLLQRLEANIGKAAESIREISELVHRNQPAQGQQLHQLADDILSDIELDVAAVLAVVLGADSRDLSEQDTAIAQRCSRMSVLSMAVGTELGFSGDDQHAIGIAGLLHDISLLSAASTTVDRIASTLPFNHQFLDHPVASAYILESVLGLDRRICLAASQVHEQPNGGGFPKGLPSHRMMPISKLLSTVDAYLTLTAEKQPEPFPRGVNLQPCDAVAYLMYNVIKGRFDAEVIKGLVRSLSFYPIGSRVELSDGSQAVVLRSSKSEPSRPIVRIDDASSNIMDLSGTSIKVNGPGGHQLNLKNRISKAQMDEVLFR
jgi:HD-GYP domain-containing protein (c-di-GMP phosphodiesterase class II)